MYAFELARAWALSFSQFSFLRSLTASAIPASADRETLIPRDFASLRRVLSSDRFVGLRMDFVVSAVCMELPFREMFYSVYAHSSWADRKSTRLNSSHVRISYAVFCV